MADTRISKIRVRQGDYDDLPMLDAGEFGYAKDRRRLFIGNDTVTVGTGNGSATQFVVDIDLSSPNILAVYNNGTLVNASEYDLVGTTLTFNTAPANGNTITIRFNSEVSIDKDATIPSSILLAANGAAADTGFQFDTTQYNACFMDYTVESTVGVRIGQLRFVIDTSSGNAAIDESYAETSPMGIVFDVSTATANTLKLIYTDSEGVDAKFKYTYQLWNSN